MSKAKSKAKSKLGIKLFNEMQEDAFEKIPKGNDIELIAPTGSGKTLAFLIPILSIIDVEILATQVLIIAPTRELVLQIESVARNLGLGYNIISCYGGHPVRTEKKMLESPTHIICGTPGRLQDHLNRENIKLDFCRFLVLDEFDKTLEMGFQVQMKSILKHFSRLPQTILTSATKIEQLPDFIKLGDTTNISYQKKTDDESIQIWEALSPTKDKIKILHQLLHDLAGETCMIFCNYRETVDRIHDFLKSKKIVHDSIHGAMDQQEREIVLSKFRNGSSRILVSTDLTGRGIDIDHVENVIHYHFPITKEVLTHRNGRTARMGNTGKVYFIKSSFEHYPEYVQTPELKHQISGQYTPIPKPEWASLKINKGKRDKINKMDVVGFLYKIGNLQKEELGKIEIRNTYCLAAVHQTKIKYVLDKIRDQKIKGKSARFSQI